MEYENIGFVSAFPADVALPRLLLLFIETGSEGLIQTCFAWSTRARWMIQ